MTKLLHPYSLQAFPTEKILKEFKPVRGCYARGKIELPPGQAEQLWASLRNRDADPLAWQKPTVEVDLRPLFDAIAVRMGYDPALLAEGRGETGRADHAWSAYADESGFPLLIRWQAGQGELLLSIGIFGREELSVAMLADEAGLETLLKVHELPSDRGDYEHLGPGRRHDASRGIGLSAGTVLLRAVRHGLPPVRPTTERPASQGTGKDRRRGTAVYRHRRGDQPAAVVHHRDAPLEAELSAVGNDSAQRDAVGLRAG